MSEKAMNLQQESERATALLKGKAVDRVKRHKQAELLVEFTDGTRLFVDARQDELEISITGGVEEITEV